MKRLSLPAAFGVVLALLFAGLGGAPAFAGSNPVPIYLKADPCPGASLCGNFLTGQFKGSGKRTTQFAALPNLTVTRASFAYGENADGSLKGFQAGQARVTSKGLGVFEATTNLLTWSQAFSNAAWNKAAIASATDNQAVAPDGTLTAALIVPNAVATEHFVSQAATVTAASYEPTLYAKAAGYTKVGWREATTSGAYCTWDLNGPKVISQTGATCGTPIQAVNGWYRLPVTYTGAATSQVQSLYVLPTAYTSGDPHASTAAGDGVSGAYFWGADLRLGAYPVPYCPTTASTATCAADNISITGLTFPASMSLFASVDAPTTPTASDRYVITAGTVGPALTLKNTVNQLAAAVPSVGYVGSTGDRGGSSITYAAANFAQATQSAYVNGALAIGTLSWTPSGSTLWLGQNAGGGASVLNGYLRGFAYYPTQLSGGAAQALTVQGDSSSLSLNFASGLYKTTTPYVRTNLFPFSFDGTAAQIWSTVSNATVGAGTTPSRFSGATSTLVTTTGTDGRGQRNFTVAADTTAYVFSVDIQKKAGVSYKAEVGIVGGTGVATTLTFDGGTGVVSAGTGASVVSGDANWWRVSIPVVNNGTASNTTLYTYVAALGGSGQTFNIATPQLESGRSTATSYIATFAATGATASVATTQSTNPADVGALSFTGPAGYAPDCNGNLISFAANNPRITCAGVLIEEARTNLALQSQNFASATWLTFGGAAKVGSAPVADPLGGSSAYEVSFGSTGGPLANAAALYQPITMSASATYSGCFYVRAASGTTTVRVSITLDGGSTLGTGDTSVTTAWSRICTTQTVGASPVATNIALRNNVAGTSTNVYVWQADLQAGAFITSPILTTSASATRSADVMSYAYTPPTTGTLATSWSAPITPADQFPAFLSDGTLNNRVHFAQSATTGNLNAVVNNGGAVTSFSTANVVTGSGVACGALSYTGGAQIASLNGGTNATAAGATIPTTLSTLTVGGGGAATAARQLNGYVRDVAVFAYAANSNETPYRAACNF